MSATAPNTTTSQRRRARRADGLSLRARSASTGWIRDARRAGSMAAMRVTKMPTIAGDEERIGRKHDRARGSPSRPSASRPPRRPPGARPRPSPITDPMTPMTRACVSMKPMTWSRLAPAARSRPTSRIRSPTVIESVLKMRNAPANRAIAAMSAVVAWKSAVEPRIVAARSWGDESTYGWVVRPRLERGADDRPRTRPRPGRCRRARRR